jgi:minor structural protein GP20
MAEGEGAQSGAEGTQSGAGDSTTDGSTATTTGEGTQSGTETVDVADLQRRAAEADVIRTRMQAADQRAAKFEEELKKLRDKDLPEAEKMKRDFEASQQQVQTLQKTNSDLAVRVAFLEDNTYSWHDPKTALKLVDFDQIQIDGDGKVSGMKDALKALATSHPYLVKTEVDNGGGKTTPPGTAAGNNGTSSGSNKAKADQLTSRFPVMRTRVKPQ